MAATATLPATGGAVFGQHGTRRQPINKTSNQYAAEPGNNGFQSPSDQWDLCVDTRDSMAGVADRVGSTNVSVRPVSPVSIENRIQMELYQRRPMDLRAERAGPAGSSFGVRSSRKRRVALPTGPASTLPDREPPRSSRRGPTATTPSHMIPRWARPATGLSGASVG